MAQEDIKRVSVNFSGGAYEQLKELADDQGLTVSETLRKAIALNRWFIDTQKDSKILIEKNGRIQEILRVSL